MSSIFQLRRQLLLSSWTVELPEVNGAQVRIVDCMTLVYLPVQRKNTYSSPGSQEDERISPEGAALLIESPCL